MCPKLLLKVFFYNLYYFLLIYLYKKIFNQKTDRFMNCSTIKVKYKHGFIIILICQSIYFNNENIQNNQQNLR